MKNSGSVLIYGRLILFAIIFFHQFLVIPSYGSDFQTWSDLTTNYRFSNRWRYDGDLGIRGVLSDSDPKTLYIRPSVRYRINPSFTVHGGIRFFQTFKEDDDNTFEVGPWQGLQLVWPMLGNYPITHYLRIEERMIWTEGDGDFNFTLRSRYRLGTRTPVYDIIFKNGMFLMGSAEAFCDIENPIYIDRLRFDVGAGTKISDSWRVQLHYLLNLDKSSPGESFTADEHVLRLRLFYTF